METFELTLKNEKAKSYRLIILFLVILHVLFFTYLLFDQQLWKNGVAGLVVTLLYIGYRLLITNTSRQKFSLGSGYFFVLSIISAGLSWWVWALELLLSALSQIALTPVNFTFTSTVIKRVGIPYKNYRWEELSNVILKDNILTLDFINNKLLQSEIETKNVNEEAFNTFAKAQLNK